MPVQLFEGETKLGRKLIADVRAVAAERPDHIYEKPNVGSDIENARTCVYVWNGKPSCLIGQGLWRGGLIDALFADEEMNYEGILHLADSDWWTNIKEYASLSDREVAWLRDAQRVQDAGEPWGAAIVEADTQDHPDRFIFRENSIYN